MNLTEAERVKLGIKTSAAVDASPDRRKSDRKKADRDRKAKQRRAANKQTRDEYIANAKTTTKPWDVECISRRTWYRRQMAQVVPLYKSRMPYRMFGYRLVGYIIRA
jgi:hypothetical protein